MTASYKQWRDNDKLNCLSDKIKEKSHNLLTPANCSNLSVPLIKKEIWSQFKNHQKKVRSQAKKQLHLQQSH